MKARVIPNKAGTKKRPRGVKLRVRATWTTPPGFEKPIVQRATALFPRGSLYNGHKYPRCSKRKLNRGGLRACPKRSIMGSGRAVAYADTEVTRARITVVNGGPRRVCLYTVMSNPARVRACVPGTIRRRRGRWRYHVTFKVPEVLQVVAGIPIALRSFRVTAGRGKWLATTFCPRSRRWPYRITTYQSNGTESTFRASVRCRR